VATLIQDCDFAGVAGAVATGILRGRNMHSWWESFPPVDLHDLPGSRPGERMQHFFATLPIDDVPTGVNGCIQTSTFARRARPGGPAVSLAEWVAGNFLQKCRWLNPAGRLSGFLYRPVMVLDAHASGAIRLVDEDLELKISEVGTRYGWAVVRLDLPDYMCAFPVIGKFSRFLSALNREAAYLVLHPDFFPSALPVPAGCVESCSFGYSVTPWTVLPSIAAYGPGRFHSAFKQFRFFLLEDGTVSIEVLFLVAPRCERVLNIGGHDPVFGTVRLVDALTFRGGSLLERSHASIDRYAMGHHARVHRNLLAGMRPTWEETNWQPAGNTSAAS
jgi:hypothetical protein